MSDLEKLCKEQGIPIEQLSEFLVMFGELFEDKEEDQ